MANKLKNFLVKEKDLDVYSQVDFAVSADNIYYEQNGVQKSLGTLIKKINKLIKWYEGDNGQFFKPIEDEVDTGEISFLRQMNTIFDVKLDSDGYISSVDVVPDTVDQPTGTYTCPALEDFYESSWRSLDENKGLYYLMTAVKCISKLEKNDTASFITPMTSTTGYACTLAIELDSTIEKDENNSISYDENANTFTATLRPRTSGDSFSFKDQNIIIYQVVNNTYVVKYNDIYYYSEFTTNIAGTKIVYYYANAVNDKEVVAIKPVFNMNYVTVNDALFR